MRVLDVVVDILLLLCIALSALGHMFPWVRVSMPRVMPRVEFDGKIAGLPQEVWRQKQEGELRNKRSELMTLQAWHATRSAIGLGVLAVLVSLSLLFDWGRGARRVLVLLMFLAALAAIAFISLIFTPYPLSPHHQPLAGTFYEEWGFFLALIPACFAGGFILIRMIWTMPHRRNKTPPAPAQPLPEGKPLPSEGIQPLHQEL